MLVVGGVVSWFGLHEVGRLQETGRPPIEESTSRMTDDNSRLAVLIDADNTSPKLIKEMFEELAGYGTLTVKRAYGDWTNQHLTSWKEHLLANATDQVAVPVARVAVVDHEVGRGALARSAFQPEPLPGPPRSGAQRVVGRQPELDHRHDLAGQVAVAWLTPPPSEPAYSSTPAS